MTHIKFEWRGFTVETETDPWAIKYGSVYRVTNGEYCVGVKTIEDALELIVEKTQDEYENEITL